MTSEKSGRVLELMEEMVEQFATEIPERTREPRPAASQSL